MPTTMRILPLGDTAFTAEFSDLRGAEGARRVRQLRERIEAARDAGQLQGIIDLISAVRSLTVCIDPDTADYAHIQASIEQLAQTSGTALAASGQTWTLPVCYTEAFGADLPQVAQAANLSVDALIALHSGQVYDVLLIGFLPGFPFMAQVPEPLRLPRRETPRLQVPAGSVAIANEQTAIYPWQSPGGWHLIGRCPVPLFDAHRERPSLLAPGDQVRFRAIDDTEFAQLERALAKADVPLSAFQTDVP